MENKTLPEIENTINNTNPPTLFETIKFVSNKYKHNTNILLANEELTIEYLVCRHYEQAVYKTINVEEFENMLKITILPERIVRIVDINGKKVFRYKTFAVLYILFVTGRFYGNEYCICGIEFVGKT